jgi:hypothetical protein
MSSTSYNVPTHVLDGGGTSSSSTSYRLLNALGQPTPIGVAQSTSYMGYLGYIYTIPMEEPEYLCGDVNGSGSVTSADGFHTLNHLGDPITFPIVSCWSANVNGDGNLTSADGFHLLNYFGDPGSFPLTCAPCTGYRIIGERTLKPEAIEGRRGTD